MSGLHEVRARGGTFEAEHDDAHGLVVILEGANGIAPTMHITEEVKEKR